MAKAPAKAAPTYYRVELSKPFERRGFTYKPGTEISVKQDVLDEMEAAGVVSMSTPVAG